MAEETPETRIALLEQSTKIFMDKLEEIDKKNSEEHSEIKKSVDSVNETLLKLPKSFFDEADKRYASKETELNVKRIGWIIVTVFVLALLALVIKNGIPSIPSM